MEEGEGNQIKEQLQTLACVQLTFLLILRLFFILCNYTSYKHGETGGVLVLETKKFKSLQI